MTDQTTEATTPDQIVKPGYTTTEFWVTLLTVAAAAVGVLDPSLHLSSYVQGAAVAVSGIATIVYTASRHGIKTAAFTLASDYVKSLKDK